MPSISSPQSACRFTAPPIPLAVVAGRRAHGLDLNLFALPATVQGVIPIDPGLFRLVSNGPEPLELLPGGWVGLGWVGLEHPRGSPGAPPFASVTAKSIATSAVRQFAAIGSATRVLLV
jgi:hypothetical protein